MDPISETKTVEGLSHILYLSTGVLADGRPYYAYLSLTPDDYVKLKDAEVSGNFRLSEYGHILVGEIGVREPSVEVQQKVIELFETSGVINEEIRRAFLDVLESSQDKPM
ncbi:MAG: hypothetical protein ACK48E_02875 [Holosporales bacterium]|jgi:hypothetical protein